jgi:hypothetical protein
MPIDHQLTKLPVTKLDAARRQLETAITLWFHDSDPVSIHTLASAAYQILYDINSKRGGKPMMPDSPNIRPERYKEVRQVLAQAENFFKHADRDPKETLFFAPEATQYHLLEAVDKYHEMAHEQRPLMRLFIMYHALTNPDVFLAEFIQRIRQQLPPDILDGISKAEFYHHLLPHLSKFHAA